MKEKGMIEWSGAATPNREAIPQYKSIHWFDGGSNSQFNIPFISSTKRKTKVFFFLNQWNSFLNWCWWKEKEYYNSNCYIGTSYRGDTLSNSQFDEMNKL